MGQQREVFPGLDSGPNGSEGHYFYALEKRPSADPLYTTEIVFLRLINRRAILETRLQTVAGES